MEKIKEKLLTMQNMILAEVESSLDISRTTVTGTNVDEIEQAADAVNREFSMKLCERDQLKLKQIRQALQDINDDNYGICQNCGERIATKRLQTLPFTDLCFDCKEEMEKIRLKFLG